MEVILITLLQYLKENNLNQTNAQIAKILIDHINELATYNLTDFCELCNCSESTFSRFLKILGLENYRTFHMILKQPRLVYDQAPQTLEETREKIYSNMLIVNQLSKYLNYKSIIYSIKQARCIFLIAFPTTITYLLDFQCKMMLLGKKVELISSYQLKVSFMEFSKEDLVLIVSFHGNILVKQEKNLIDLPNYYLITTNQIQTMVPSNRILLCGKDSTYEVSKFALQYFLDMVYNSCHGN